MGTAPNINRMDGKYRLLAQLGQGGTSDVSLAVARGPSGFNKLVVLKSMRATMRSEPELARMFLNEARLAARLNHPNIVQTNEVFEYDGLPVIVMEYLDGQPLSAVLSRAKASGKFTTAMHLRVISESLSGVNYSHELADFDGTPLNVVHRDMSPHNVFLTFEGQVKVLDFGIAKLSASLVETATGVIKGKLHYMPPEQIAGEGIDRRTDLYAIGVMLWEAATGQRMWRNRHDAAVMNSILNAEIPKTRDVREVDPELDRIVDKALSFHQADRYQTALELQNDLDAYLSRIGSPTLRDIGKVVAELFADTRAETQRLIELQLSKVASLSSAEYAARGPGELTATTTAFLGDAASHSGVTVQPVRSRQSRWVLVLAAVALLGVGAWLARWKSGAANAADGASGAPTTAAAARDQVRLHVTAFPGHAKVYIDGKLAPSNPFARNFPRAPGVKHELKVEADGYVTETRPFEFDADTELVVDLQEVKADPASEEEAKKDPRPHWRIPSVAPQVVAPRPAPGPRVDCEPPFFIDSRGVKTFKPQCL